MLTDVPAYVSELHVEYTHKTSCSHINHPYPFLAFYIYVICIYNLLSTCCDLFAYIFLYFTHMCAAYTPKVPPLYVRLQGLNQPLVASVRTQVSCSSAGARPSPQIVWNKGGIVMRGASQTVSTIIYIYFLGYVRWWECVRACVRASVCFCI